MKTVLTIAGSDSSGGAGIQADIKTITAHKLYASSAITALTAQNTTGVYGIMEASPEFLASQLDCIFQDIFPDAVKIGMVSSAPLIEVIVEKLKTYQAKHIVVDPVMVSTSGSRLLAGDAANTLIGKLIPMAEVITPNIPEGEVLGEFSIESAADMERAAKKIAESTGTAVLMKGGHEQNDANDVLCRDGECKWFMGERIDNPNTHGTGCTLSSAIACGLAKGLSLEDSVKEAKDYISGALRAGLNLGKGSGPLNHMFCL
ncbi:MAG: bifunctional hydroxymethylpyrimidine kinase/phosphomethylpyrimidine kinase [Ruminococcus sp.]|jgi:hydroxymethylpyrimidine/phosphomethylpyrimidine kinase